MIISHKHKFIFIHGRKTAGSSIGISLMRYLSSGDVVRGYITGGLKHDIYPPDWNKSLIFLRPSDLRHVNWKVRAYRRFVNRKHSVSSTHLSALEIKKLVGEQIWNSYFKFSFIRNPYDRIVSFYYWRISDLKNPPTFSQFIESLLTNNNRWLKNNNLHNFSNWNLYTINDKVSVDFLGCYDRLECDISHVFDQIGLKYDGWLPHNKSGIRPQEVKINELLNSKLQFEIKRYMQREIDLYYRVK